MRRYDLLLRVCVLLLLSLVILAANPNFGRVGNLINIARQASLLYILAIGMTLVIIVGGIDLSNGAVLALSSCIFGLCVVYKVPIAAAVLIALAVGAVCGLLNGLIIAHLRIPPFIVTFAMAYITRGLAYYFMHSSSIQGFDARFRFIGTGSIVGIPMPIVWAALLFLIFHVVLENTPFGVSIRSVGGNPESSRLAGLSVSRTVVTVYGLNGLLAASAGLIYTARLNNAEAVIGSSFPLDSIAAVIIGGASLFGGEAHLAGTLVGVLILTVILNGMNLTGIPSLWQAFITGFVILLMVATQTHAQRVGLRRRFTHR